MTNTDLGVYWSASGNKTHRIYIGVDTGWYNSTQCGSSWCRPVFNLSGSSNDAWLDSGSDSYYWIDNIEFINMQNNENGVHLMGAGTGIRASNLYFHAWSHAGGKDNVGFFSQGGPGAIADHNVIDGSDSSRNTFNAFTSWSAIQYNVIKYVVSGLVGGSDVVHDNVLSNTVTSADSDHCNGFFTSSLSPATRSLFITT